MPPKKCASCEKTVFPMEELKCLDKTWHKGCFKCQVCNMTLNMKNYKGYNKLPYCNAHYPETKFTAVADTPESKRLAQNSKIQSNVKYHAEYEKERGQYTAVADDPETLRVRKNMETISNVAYHGDLIRRNEMENARPNEYEPSSTSRGSYPAPPTSYTAPPPQQQRSSSTSSQGYPSPQFMEFAQPVPVNIPYDYRPPVQGPRSYSRPVVTIGKGEAQAIAQQPVLPPPQQGGYGRRPGSINDYDPMTGSAHANSPYSNKTQSSTVYNSQQHSSQAYGAQASAPHVLPPQATAPPSNQYNQRSMGQQPAAYSYGQQAPQPFNPQSNTQSQQVYRPPYNPTAMAPPPQMQPAMPPPQQRPPPQHQPRDPYYGKGNVSKAIYDYTGADDDEVSFGEDDIIIQCEPIDEGWMTGTVERTGQHGMLPSNYVEHLNW